jgi:hypothetical protein
MPPGWGAGAGKGRRGDHRGAPTPRAASPPAPSTEPLLSRSSSQPLAQPRGATLLPSVPLTMADIVMIQVHCPDLSLYGTFNKVYRTYFQDAFPARAF